MSAEHIPGAILFALVFFAAALALWYCGVRWNILRLKQFAVMIGIFPVLGVGLTLVTQWFDLGGGSDYRTVAHGPAQREPAVTTEVMIPVNNTDREHQIELTPKIWGADHPSEPTHLRLRLKSPTGDVVVEDEQDLTPSGGFRWSKMFTRFQPRGEGQYTLALDIRQPVGSIDVLVRELR